MGENIFMSKQELKRYTVMDRWMKGLVTGGEATELLGLSYRQVCRLKKRGLQEGKLESFTKTEVANRHMRFLTIRAKGSGSPPKRCVSRVQ